ncbi:hypothetical protein Tco_0596022 [Tanacetum coccineum]
MDSIIPLGQKNTLAEYMILSGADNRPPMLDKDLYDSWKSRMELYMKNREHDELILESIKYWSTLWPISVASLRFLSTNNQLRTSSNLRNQATIQAWPGVTVEQVQWETRSKYLWFDNVVKIRTTPDARIEGEWGFEHTKAIFNNEIIPFLKSLKDIFNVFDRDLLNEIMEVQIVFDQMDAVVQQSSVDKQCLEIAKKELLLENA